MEFGRILLPLRVVHAFCVAKKFGQRRMVNDNK